MAGKKRLNELSEALGQAGVSRDETGQAAAGGGARPICASSDLADGGDGVRFEVEHRAETVPAFAIRYGGRVYAYVNRCAHIAMELDWNPGKFFDTDGEYLICSTHGALYAPESGKCRGGPCRGAGLIRLDVFESDGKVFLTKG